MPIIRHATKNDLEQTVNLAMRNLRRRNQSDATLWKPATDAVTQLEQHHASALKEGVLLVCETEGGTIGFAIVWLLPAPAVYDLGGKIAGLIEDVYAPDLETANALISQSLEQIKSRNGGVAAFQIPATWTDQLELAQQHKFEAGSEFWVKTNLESHSQNALRHANQTDLSSIVAWNAQAQQRKYESNSRFWKVHPDADSRFEGWMRHSLSLADRTIFVSRDAGGYIVAQPTRLLPGHRTDELIGCIDDFWSEDFGYSLEVRGENLEKATDLLRSAESDFVIRGATIAFAITTSAWKSKNRLLELNGYEPAYVWMLKNL
jgi:hypothetical protein